MIIITLISVFIYLFTLNHRKQIFLSRLEDRATSISEIYAKNIEDFDIKKDVVRSGTNALLEESIIIVDIKTDKIFKHGKYSDEIDTTNFDEFQSGTVYIENKGKYEGCIVHAIERDVDIIVQVIATDTYGFLRLKFLRLVLGISWLSALVITSLASWFFVRNVLSPISDVIEQVNTININNLDSRVNEGNGKDEIALLARTFNDMLERLEFAFNLQRTFVSNASHELKTPLTAITSQLEVSLLNDRSIDEYKVLIESVLDDIKNLNGLTQKLLDLAQVNINNINVPFEKIRIDEFILNLREDYINRIHDFNIKIYFEKFPDDENQLMIFGNEHLLKIAINNILDNAYKYSYDKSVFIYFNIVGNKIKIAFKDNGIGIDELDLKKITEPFYRASNAINIKGHGIGLSLTKRIINLHNAKFETTSKINVGTSIILNFPIAKF